jgi:hypothetical protein
MIFIDELLHHLSAVVHLVQALGKHGLLHVDEYNKMPSHEIINVTSLQWYSSTGTP